jgi:hypothetical protein
MKYACSIIFSFGLSFVAAAFATMPANAQGSKTFVSIFGSDSMDCLTGPTACRTAQRAIEQTSPGGEVVFDSPGDFFTATVNKPLTLNFIHNGQMDQPSDGGPASANLLFSPPSADANLYIRGLYMNLLNRNANGIQVNRGNLFLQNSSIQNVGGTTRSAVLFQPDDNAGIFATDCILLDGPIGINVAPRAGADVTAVISNNTIGKFGTGVRSAPPAGTTSNVVVQNSTISGGGIAIQSNSSRSTLAVKNSTIAHNTTGLSRPGGGVLVSLTGNSLPGNTVKGSFSGTVNPE